MRHLWLLSFLWLASPGFGQFRVGSSSVEMAEGGRVNFLTISSDEDRFSVRQPPGYTFRIDAPNKSLLFRSEDEKTAISLQFTTNSPGQLPAPEILRTKVIEQTPGGGILQSSICSTGYKPGYFFDLVRISRGDLSVRFRHVYIACPKGTVECVFATDNEDFENRRFILSNFLNSFHLETAISESAPKE